MSDLTKAPVAEKPKAAKIAFDVWSHGLKNPALANAVRVKLGIAANDRELEVSVAKLESALADISKRGEEKE